MRVTAVVHGLTSVGSRLGLPMSALIRLLLPAFTCPMTPMRQVRRSSMRSASSTKELPCNSACIDRSSRPQAISSERKVSSLSPICRRSNWGTGVGSMAGGTVLNADAVDRANRLYHRTLESFWQGLPDNEGSD